MRNEQALILRVNRSLYENILEDLCRPHAYAFERVGFMYGKMGSANSAQLIIAYDYQPVSDEHYIEDSSCGARIDSHAIRAAMQKVLPGGICGFHVHMHGHYGRPALSWTDRREIPKIVDGLRNASSKVIHGLLILSEDHGIADMWRPGFKRSTPASRISIVGQPMTFFDRRSDV